MIGYDGGLHLYALKTQKEIAIKITTRAVQVGNQAVHYQEVGQGQPVILVHGLSASSLWWRRNITALAQHYHVYLVDLPGFGSMRRYHRSFALDELATSLLAWMEAVNIHRAHLIGHSMGGYICLRLAASRPEVVDRLVLVAPAGIPSIGTIAGYCIPLLTAVRYMRPSFLPILFYDALRCGPLMLLRATRELLTKDVRDRLAAITAPTLLVWGEHDTLVPPMLGDMLHQAIAGSSLLILKHAGHVVMFDQARQFNAALLAFLAGEKVA